MELLIKIHTGESLSVSEAAELAAVARRKKVKPDQLATTFIREGLERRRAQNKRTSTSAR